MAKTQTLYANNARTTLGSTITTSSVSFTVADPSAFPTISSAGQSFYVTLFDNVNIEVVLVTSVSGSTFTVTRAQDGTTAHAFASATTVVSHRLIAANLRNYARLDDHMGALSGIAALTAPSTMNGNSYVLGDNSADSTYITAVANTGLDLWSFTSYPAITYNGTVGAGASTTVINLATATSILRDQTSLAYILQFTSGALKGQARFISAMTSSTITLSSAMGSTPGSGDTYSIHRHVGSNLTAYVHQAVQMLDPIYVTSSINPVAGDKRLTAGGFQMNDGTSWNAYPLNYIPSTAASLGSYTIAGTNSGYAGFTFSGAFHGQAMIASATVKQSGVYSTADSTWDWRWDAGVLGVGTVPYANVSGTPDLTVYAPKASPTLTGTPLAPTAAYGTNTTQIATTAFVKASIVTTGNAVTGTRKYPDGTIEQWFEYFAAGAGGGVVTITYPTAFTNSYGKPQITIYDTNVAGIGASNFVAAQVTAASLTGCSVSIGQNGGGNRDVTLIIEVRGS